MCAHTARAAAETCCEQIYIYYPRSAGGGIKKLFRKTGDKSSEYCKNEWAIRRDGSFIYEDFLPTEGHLLAVL